MMGTKNWRNEDIICYDYGNKGPYVRDCPKKTKRGNQITVPWCATNATNGAIGGPIAGNWIKIPPIDQRVGSAPEMTLENTVVKIAKYLRQMLKWMLKI
jgi:hypothetical protein